MELNGVKMELNGVKMELNGVICAIMDDKINGINRLVDNIKFLNIEEFLLKSI